ncbi:MAG: WhiB family transcriptional regulator [Acidimicrobiia bacterium]|nr:WhiB family transcriptional regulator [Acidimicrobiia bacterium]
MTTSAPITIPSRRVPLELAECRDESVESFFASNASSSNVQHAKMICARCEVREECLAYALETPQIYGIWGGLTADERVLLRRSMRR